MRNLLTVTKMMIKSMSYSTKKKKAKSKSNNPLLTNLLMLVLFTAMVFAQTVFNPYGDDYASYSTYLASNLFTTMIFLTVLMSSSTIFSSYFLNTDDSNYLHLPITSGTIFLARFITSTILGCIVPLAVPLGFYLSHIVHFQHLTFNFFTFLNPLLFYFAIQFICSALMFLFGIFLSEVCHLKKHRQVMTMISFGLTIVAAILFGISYGYNEFSVMITKAITPFINSLTGISHVEYQTYLFLISIVFIALTFLLARFTYLKSLLGSGEKSSKKKNLDPEKAYSLAFSKNTKSMKLIPAFIKDELKTIFRSGTYIFQLIVPPVIMGLVMSIVVPTSFMTIKNDPSFISLSPIVFACVLQICCSFNIVTTINYTKDRQSFLATSVLPVNHKKLYIAKLIPSIVLNFLISIVFAIIYLILYPINILACIIYFIASFFASYGLSYLTQLIDLKIGNANSPNEIAATKQNKSVIFGPLLIFLIRILLALISLFSLIPSFDSVIPALITLVVSFAFGFIVHALTFNKIDLYVSKFIFRSNN